MAGAGGVKAVPSAKAFRRACLTCNANTCAALSRTPEVARVSSIFSSNWPASTTSPSFTRICDTTPPSSDCTTCSCRDGITFASPLVTSSISASAAHTISSTVTSRAERTSVCARKVAPRDITASASSSKGCIPACEAASGVTRSPPNRSRRRSLQGARRTRKRSSPSTNFWPILSKVFISVLLA